MKKKKQGFTLIELIVVIAVLVILVTIGIPRFLGQTEEANLTKLRHDARIVQDASDRYYVDNNDWPFLLDEDNNPIAITDPDRLEIIYKVENFDEEKIKEGIVKLYEIDFDKLKPYIRKLDSNTLYFVAARGNPEFGITVLDPKAKSTQERIEISVNPKYPVLSRKPIYSEEEIDALINQGYIPVATAEELNNIRHSESNIFGYGSKWEGEYTGGLNKKYIQVKNIDLSVYSSGEGWEPIGNQSAAFIGTFDGGGFKVKKLYINRPDSDYQALFGHSRNAKLRNILLENVNITGKKYVASLVGNVTGGYNMSNEITNVHSTGIINGNNSVGGLVGASRDNSIEDSHFSGTLEGKSQLGGLIGYGNYSNIRRSYFNGAITANSQAGGLMGFISIGTIENSYSIGEITINDSYIGGLVGGIDYSATIKYCYSATKLSSGMYLGGGLSGTGAGNSGGSIRDSYWDIEVSGYAKSGGGKGLTTAGMKQSSSYNNWDFETIWDIIEGVSYPFLRNNPQSSPPM